MAGVEYTKEQKKVITTRNRNLLVSAAAGSGKTAVLVERIVQMVSDESNPLDIDRLLVVTFTNAAASEMRERIGDAFEKKLDKDPNNKHLHRQLALLTNANIMTIHAFCLKVIRSHFNVIQLDPSFRIGDENELFLLKSDVIKELLEEKYKEGEERFLKFVESYSGSKTDDVLEELIIMTHRFAVSNPWPEEWLESQIENLNIHSEEELLTKSYYSSLVKQTEISLRVIFELLNSAKELAEEEDGPIHYMEAINLYYDNAKKIEAALNMGYNAVWEAFKTSQPVKLSQKRTGFDPNLKEMAKRLIDLVKEETAKLETEYYLYSLKDLIDDIHGSYEALSVLKELTIDFIKRYQTVKGDKNIIDFNDIEHFALEILINKDETWEYKPSLVAESFSMQFDEILIDEYQDSNLVQELILNSVSKEEIEEPNIFMVGDIKQSIYKFRLAKPELFMEKYNSYSDDESLYQRINLHKNFRSREHVINIINFFFKQVMSTEIGDVEYDDNAALFPGAMYDDLPDNDLNTEVIILHEPDEDEEIDVDKKEGEARAIAEQIRQMVEGEKNVTIYDKKRGIYRRVEYKDIVILLRSLSGWTDELLDVLKQNGIPAYSSTTTGYFDTVEIRTIMNMLQIIDNPRQDIPLVAVLRSPIVGLRGGELVRIRKAFDEGEMYDAVVRYIGENINENNMENNNEDQLAVKIKLFLDDLNHFRTISKYMPMDELIHEIFKRTHYDLFCSLMSNGKQRKANLELFIDKAVAYEKSSYRGVFNFIRYVEHIKKYDIDTGEASIYSENDNLVKIMSIHKSKGLEFPVVFIAGLGKQFNKQDLRQSIVFHQDLGIGADYVNVENRFRVTTLPKTMIKKRLEEELLSEELRILYVALTRAKEKLYLVASIKNPEKQIEKWSESLRDNQIAISSRHLKGAHSYLDWLMIAFIRHPDGKALRDYLPGQDNIPIDFTDEKSHIAFHIKNIATIETEEALQEENKLLDILKGWQAEDCNDVNMSDIDRDKDNQPDIIQVDAKHNIKTIHDKLNWQYEYYPLTQSKVQMSVSDIKRLNQQEEEIISFEKAKVTPKFIEESLGLTSAERGTAYHKVMHYIDLKLNPSDEAVAYYLEGLTNKKILSKLEYKGLKTYPFIKFLKSDLYRRMQTASKSLRREVPFVIGIPANEMYDGLEKASKDLVMIQGVIDAFFEEDGQIVLVDYKTDFIQPDEEIILIKRYHEQMSYYKRALEQITNKAVKETILYSFSLSKEINL